MRLRDLGRTTAFRLTMLFSALLISSVLILFGLIYWQSSVFLTKKLDESLIREAQEFLRTPDDDQSMVVDNLVGSDPSHDWQVGLFDPKHRIIAGNISAWPQNVTFDGRIRGLEQGLPGATGHLHHDIRVLAVAMPDGNYFVVAHRADEVHEMREVITGALMGGLLASVGLALVGGLIMSFATLRRIEAMHRAAGAIMTGDLSRRLPETGSGDDFDKLAKIVNVMLTEIERLIGDIKAAGDNIAHDLRTPLTRLRTGLEGALRRGESAESYRAAMEDAIVETDQLLATFRALLRISEVEAGQRRAGFGPVDLVKLATSAAELFEPIAAERGLTFTAEIEPAAAVRGDPDLLFEAVANLLDNAIKFTPQGGTVRLSLSADSRLMVQDDGPGLPLDIKETLFQRFTRGDKARQTPGNGLGLSLVAAVVRLHGLILTVEDVSPGCRMRIDFIT